MGVNWLTRPSTDASRVALPTAMPAELMRPLAEYESALGGRW
jgi:hypothetical protein